MLLDKISLKNGFWPQFFAMVVGVPMNKVNRLYFSLILVKIRRFFIFCFSAIKEVLDISKAKDIFFILYLYLRHLCIIQIVKLIS